MVSRRLDKRLKLRLKLRYLSLLLLELFRHLFSLDSILFSLLASRLKFLSIDLWLSQTFDLRLQLHLLLKNLLVVDFQLLVFMTELVSLIPQALQLLLQLFVSLYQLLLLLRGSFHLGFALIHSLD